ncbi:ArsR/SmtB family transcription factor [Thalassotalea sediminis]|uniref:ArsR/SmtB family transcription factor n=1 Tax=Thalassotalea sediminis TaxID=1759089 RepID=UPI002573978E|nr:helix-turn-helix transcriptional regulator [Thalassotalea sediminis]
MDAVNIYKALGDPVRLEMVQRLANGDVNTIGELSHNLGVTRQGARKQLQVLVSANLVTLSKQGRETHVSLDAHRLKIAEQFIAELTNQWDSRLSALKNLTER